MNHNCHYFNQSECLSCEGLGVGLAKWRTKSLDEIQALLPSAHWSEATLCSSAFGSRNKAKFAVGGTILEPKLGRFTSSGEVVDLKDCSLYSPAIKNIIPSLYQWISDYKLHPYDVSLKSGELKTIIVVEGIDDSLLIRFMVRSKVSLDRLQKLAKSIAMTRPQDVVSMNLQPQAKAILEGDEEIVLSELSTLRLSYNNITLKLPTQSFVQTNHEIASKLYLKAKQWTRDISGNILELFCGIGGFSSHLIQDNRKVVGIELSASAIEAAKSSVPGASFIAMDAWEYLKTSEAFDLIVVNPPRRGLGKDICQKILQLKPKYLLYSSCNPQTFAADLNLLGYKISRIEAFEMFPLTNHWEVLALLTLQD